MNPLLGACYKDRWCGEPSRQPTEADQHVIVQPSLVHVVDDDEAVRDSLAILLEAAGHDVRTYASGDEFLDAAQRTPPAGCLVTDVQMPGVSGIELLRRLQELRIELPAVVISAQNGSIREAAIGAGAAAFIAKPVDEQRLLDALSAALPG